LGGQEFTAKDFRTWFGTVLAVRALEEFGAFGSQREAKKNLLRAVEQVAAQLGNTKTVCRKCYIHPTVLDAYLDGSLVTTLNRFRDESQGRPVRDLSPEETAVLAFLESKKKGESRPRR
jgi:DNA topoisomerase-1